MSKTLLIFKQTLSLKKGLILDEKLIRGICKNVTDLIEDTPQFKKGQQIYIRVEGETNIGDVQSETIDDLLKEIISRQIELKSLKVYASFNSSSKDEPCSFFIDVYLGRFSNNSIDIHGSDEAWVLESKSKMEYFFNKVPLISVKKENFSIRLLNFIFNGKLLLCSWAIVILSLLFSRFFPNIYYSWVSVFITAYALIGVVVKVLLEQKIDLPLVMFMLKAERDDRKTISTIEYIEKQPLVMKIILFIFALTGFISTIMQIIAIAKQLKWIS